MAQEQQKPPQDFKKPKHNIEIKKTSKKQIYSFNLNDNSLPLLIVIWQEGKEDDEM